MLLNSSGVPLRHRIQIISGAPRTARTAIPSLVTVAEPRKHRIRVWRGAGVREASSNSN